MTFNVSGKTLNAVLNQRSQDMLTANGWNVMQYAVLLHMLAQVSGLEAGELVHVIADCHIYDRHVPLVEDLLRRGAETLILGCTELPLAITQYGIRLPATDPTLELALAAIRQAGAETV